MTTCEIRLLLSKWLQDTCEFHGGLGVCRPHPLIEDHAHPCDVAAMPKTFSDIRRKTFLLGRAAARSAMADIGVAPVSLPRAPSGAPLWPNGYIGSITHSETIAIAVIARRGRLAGIGVDVEDGDRALPPGVFDRILTPEERNGSIGAAGRASASVARRVFCAKEAAFKAYANLLSETIGFWDITIHHAEDVERFIALPPVSSGTPRCYVRTHALHGLVLAFATIAPELP